MVSPSLITQSNEGRVVKVVMVSKVVRVDRVVSHGITLPHHLLSLMCSDGR